MAENAILIFLARKLSPIIRSLVEIKRLPNKMTQI